MTLSATAVKQAKPRDKNYKLSDEKGSYLLVTRAGGKYWRFKYRFMGREKSLALGTFPEVSLAQSRQRRDDARALLANDIDPGEARKARKLARREEAENSFRAIATEWFTTKMQTRSKSHQTRTWRALEKDLFPDIGNKPIVSITAPTLLRALRKVEARGAIETAHRTKQIAGQVFRYAVATGRAEFDPSGTLAGALANPVKKHLASITEPMAVGKLLIAMDNYQGTEVVKTALLLSPLLMCRPGELRHMEWSEISWEKCQWEIPAEKMKIQRPHIVPLSAQALALLEQLHVRTGKGRYVFPSARGASRPLSENGVRTALRTLGYTNDSMTPHGFRAMARTLLDEELGFRIDWIEHQLAHAVKDANGRAYNRTTHLEQRRHMMQSWADYLDKLRGKITDENVIHLQFHDG